MLDIFGSNATSKEGTVKFVLKMVTRPPLLLFILRYLFHVFDAILVRKTIFFY